MLELYTYFSFLPSKIAENQWESTQVGSLIDKHTKDHFPDLHSVELVIFNIKEYQGSKNNLDNNDCYIRSALYELHQEKLPKTVDLGELNLMPTRKESFEIIKKVCCSLLNIGVLPIIIGGGNDLAYYIYRSYADLEKYISFTAIDKSFDIGLENDNLTSESYFGKIMRHNPSRLFHYTNLGYQTHFVSPIAIKMLQEMNFDLIRLGHLRSDLSNIEPIMRNTDFLSFDISAIQSSVAPANIYASPNGLSGEEACKTMHYAGLSDKLSVVGLFEYNQQLDTSRQTAQLLSQMIWYFIEGYNDRMNELNPQLKSCIKYTVAFEDGKNIIVFYKSQLSGRWWMGVPFKNEGDKESKNYFVACSYHDYEIANKGEIPDRWLKTYNKFI